MKFIKPLMASFLLIIGLSAAAQYKTLSPAEMNAQAKKMQAVFLDVRTPQEWNKGHVAGAVHLDLFNDNFETELKKLDKTKVYYVYCAVGGRSAEAAELMVKLGFKNVYNMQGGFNAWTKSGLPAVK